jgi:hypothetical protein
VSFHSNAKGSHVFINHVVVLISKDSDLNSEALMSDFGVKDFKVNNLFMILSFIKLDLIELLPLLSYLTSLLLPQFKIFIRVLSMH